MKKICLVDFDKTLISVDSILYIFYKEGMYLNLKLFVLGCIIFFTSKVLPKKNQFFFRNLFKKNILIQMSKFSSKKISYYAKFFQTKINIILVDFIKQNNYDEIIIISSSEENIIALTIKDIFEKVKIISNKLPKTDEKFRTCWNIKKVENLNLILGNLKKYNFELFTDSLDDKPLMKISNKVYKVENNIIREL